MKFCYFLLLPLLLIITSCMYLGDYTGWSGNSTPKVCDYECRRLPEPKESHCGDCTRINLEGEWDIVLDMPPKQWDGGADICCGAVDMSGDLGVGTRSCRLEGDFCNFTVTCGLSSLTNCPPGDVVLQGWTTGENTIAGNAYGCDLSGTFWATRKADQPCHLEPPPPPEEDEEIIEVEEIMEDGEISSDEPE